MVLESLRSRDEVVKPWDHLSQCILEPITVTKREQPLTARIVLNEGEQLSQVVMVGPECVRRPTESLERSQDLLAK